MTEYCDLAALQAAWMAYAPTSAANHLVAVWVLGLLIVAGVALTVWGLHDDLEGCIPITALILLLGGLIFFGIGVEYNLRAATPELYAAKQALQQCAGTLP